MQPDFLLVDGFELQAKNQGMERLARSLGLKFPTHRIVFVQGCPLERAGEDPNYLVDSIRGNVREGVKYNLIGYSFGALLALIWACRSDLRDIDQATFIDGPLSPDVGVEPPASGLFDAFRRQYERRVELARECVERLSSFDQTRINKIITVGAEEDKIVPPAAKRLPRVEHISFGPHYKGHDITPRVPLITDIIRHRIDCV